MVKEELTVLLKVKEELTVLFWTQAGFDGPLTLDAAFAGSYRFPDLCPQRGNLRSQFIYGLSIFRDLRSVCVHRVPVQSDGQHTPAETPPDSTRCRSVFIVDIQKATVRDWLTESRYFHPVEHSNFVNCGLLFIGIEG